MRALTPSRKTRRTVRRSAPLLLLILGLLLAVAACNREVPQSELDRFIASIEDLDTAVAVDTLRVLAGGEAPTATFAKYELGNIYYAMAADSARTRGWNDEHAKAFSPLHRVNPDLGPMTFHGIRMIAKGRSRHALRPFESAKGRLLFEVYPGTFSLSRPLRRT